MIHTIVFCLFKGNMWQALVFTQVLRAAQQQCQEPQGIEGQWLGKAESGGSTDPYELWT